MIVQLFIKNKVNYIYGTGSVISADGLILTCFHVCEHAENIYVLYKNRVYNALLKSVCAKCDICTIIIECKTPKFYKIGKFSMEYLKSKSYFADTQMEVVQNAKVIVPIYKTNEFPVAMLTNLKSVKGMSGSPFLNEKEEIVSILIWESDFGSAGLHPDLFLNIVCKLNFTIGNPPFLSKQLNVHDIIESGYKLTFGEKVYMSNIEGIEPGDIISHINGTELLNTNFDIKSICYMHAKNFFLKCNVHKSKLKYKRSLKIKTITV
jgi:hypothetical protein